jgi:hypothetical protein
MRLPPLTNRPQGLKPSLFIAAPSGCLAFQYAAHGSAVWNDRYSRAVPTVHCAPLLISLSWSQLIGIDTPRPGRALAENAAAVVAPCPLRR